MALDLKSLRSVPQKQKDLIAGYLREYQSVLLKANDNNPYYNIPELLTFLTLSYYVFTDYFDIISTKKVKLSNQDCSVTKINDGTWDNTVYGRQEIDPINDKRDYKWSIKIEKMRLCVDIGFACDIAYPDRALYKTRPHYALDCRSGVVEAKHGIDEMNDKRILLVPENSLKEGDIICLRFHADGDNSRIIFSKDGTDKSFAIKKIVLDRKYRMAVAMEAKNDSLTIVDFSCT